MLQTSAPYRILDCGGWTDTSFMPGGQGNCCNVAISLSVYVDFESDGSNSLTARHRTSDQSESIRLPFGGKPKTLAEAAVATLKLGPYAGGEIVVKSDVPPGSGLGGSASYSVALLAVLKPKLLADRHHLAELAWSLEAEWLGNSCGTQDQMAAAFGGVSYSKITYPNFTHQAIELGDNFLSRLQTSLMLVYTGESHFSSAMHQTVVNELAAGNQTVVEAFRALKKCGLAAAKALQEGDYIGYCRVLNDNWQAQKALHPKITTHAIESLHGVVRAIDPTCAFKGSGAGGGGSVAILVEPSLRRRVGDVIGAKFPTMVVWDNLTVNSVGVSPMTVSKDRGRASSREFG